MPVCGACSDGVGSRRGRVRGTAHRISVRVFIDPGFRLRHRRSLSEFHHGLTEHLLRGAVASLGGPGAWCLFGLLVGTGVDAIQLPERVGFDRYFRPMDGGSNLLQHLQTGGVR